MSKIKSMITLALVALGITAFAPIAQAAEPEMYAVYNTAAEGDKPAKTLSFYYDTQKASRTGTKYDLPTEATAKESWGYDGVRGEIENVVFDGSCKGYHGFKNTCYMFSDFSAATGITGLENLDMANVTQTMNMFSGCSSLTALDVSSFDTANVTSMWYMFHYCRLLTALDVSGFDTAKVTQMEGMFFGCSSLTALDVSGFDTAKVTDMSNSFYGCSKLKTIVASESFKTNAVTFSLDMFQDCTALVGGKGTKYDSNKTKLEYARIDGGEAAPGYFTPPPSVVTVDAVTGATAAVCTNGAEVTAKPVKIPYGMAFDVVYTADEGYMFKGGYQTFTTNLVADVPEITVALTDDQKPVAAEACTDCITFSADAPFGIKMAKYGTPAEPNLEYSTDKIYWSKFDLENGAAAGADHTLYIRGTNNTAFAEDTKYYAFTNTADSAAMAIACSGNVMTLLDYETVAKGEEPAMGNFAFASLFRGFVALTAAPALPATNLTYCCYNYMFFGCASLNEAPELKATKLEEYCYNRMFVLCTSLTAAPELPASNLKAGCYDSMFSGCTALTEAPVLASTNLAMGCYNGMFRGCMALTKAPSLPATDLESACYYDMFNGCTALTEAPKLSATKLDNMCCLSMFSGCTALTALPDLSATSLALYSYGNMFDGCTSLVVNTNGTGKAWSIPVEAKAAQDWSSGMFRGTSGNITNTVVEIGVTYYVVEPVKIPYEKPADVENATYKVYMGGEEVTGGEVWSNRTGKVESPADPVATVVYTANAGYVFEDGTTEKTIQLDTRVSPAVLMGDAPRPAVKIGLELGVVSQRYPWDGKVDVQYRALNWPKTGMFGAVEITGGGVVVTNALNIFGSGKGVQVIDVKSIFGEGAGNVQFKAIMSSQPTGFTEVKKLPEGAFPKEIVDEAYEVKAMDTVEGSVSPYASWDADLYISFDRDIAKDTVKVAGQWGVFPWVPFELPAMKAGEEIAFRKDVTPYEKSASWNYCCKTIQTISSGVKNLSADNTGAKMKVVLRLTSNEKATKTIDITTIKTTLVEPAE